jgi:hypothetical protein
MSKVLGLDVSTKTIGISLFDESGKLILLTHVTPKVKNVDKLSDIEVLIKKAQVFEEEFLEKYADDDIEKVIIEEPLLGSNNVYTMATLIRFNGMISRSVYETLNVVPEFISSYDSRKYAFPELMEKRSVNKKGIAYTEKDIEKSKPVLFGAYPFDIDKKMVIWEKVSELEPQIVWFYDKNHKLKKENFDMTDAYSCVRGAMRKQGLWV